MMSIRFLILTLFAFLIGNFIATSDGAFDEKDCLFTKDSKNDCESNRDCVNLHSGGPLNQYQHCVRFNLLVYPRSICCSKNYAVLEKMAKSAGPRSGADACPIFCPSLFEPVCGSDGKTYPSKCILKATACEEKNSGLVESRDQRICSELKTHTSKKLKQISIECRSSMMCNKTKYKTVCGSNGKTYINHCLLKKAACKDRTIKMVKKGKCGSSKVVVRCSNIDCKRGYDPICGSDGKTYANPCIFEYMSCKDPSIQQVKKGRCVHPLSFLSSQNQFQGDMLVYPTVHAKSSVLEIWTWPDKKIFYTISNAYNKAQKDAILDAFKSVESRTCLRFIPRKTEKDYIDIYKTGRGCFSAVGKLENGGNQTLSLDEYCFQPGFVKHELMHAIGFVHEHQRTDRDQHVTIHYENIQTGNNNLQNFDKFEYVQFKLRTPYDAKSIMHYGWNDAAIDPNKPTISSKRGLIIDPSTDYTMIDIMDINRLYKCPKNSYIEWKEETWTNDGRFFFASDCDFVGTEIRNGKSSTSKECGGLCTSDLKCTHFTWESNKGTCSLKNATNAAVTRPLKGATCGYLSKGNSIFEWQDGEDGKEKWVNGCDFPGNDLRKVKNPKEICFSLCIAEPKCTHYMHSFKYLPGWDNTCFLKTGKPSVASAVMEDVECGMITDRV